MYTERTEAEIFSRKFKLYFGGQDYEADVPNILKTGEWRRRLIEETRNIAKSLFGETTNGHDDAFFAGLGSAFLAYPEKLCTLVAAFAPALPWDEIQQIATEEEYMAAFGYIMKIAYPFSRQLSLIGEVTKSLSAPHGYTN